MNGGGFLSGAGSYWFPAASVGLGTELSRKFGLEGELLLTHARVETPTGYFEIPQSDKRFDSPVTALNAIIRVGLPFAKKVRVGLGTGILD